MKILTLCYFTLFANNCIISQNTSSIKKSIHNKYNNIKKDLLDSTFRVQGKATAYLGYRPYTFSDQRAFDYRFTANVLLSYKGVKIPLNYSFSNGRSIAGYNFPSFNTPSLNNLGFSPAYKWVKVHLGHRTMSFSPYTYDGLRFYGYGTELTPKNLQFMLFRGKLFQTSIADLNFRSGIADPAKRMAWGTLFGYKTENDELSGIVFRAEDTEVSQSDFVPKENTIIALKGKKKVFEKIDIVFEKAFSAYNKDKREPIVNILTQQTAYNLFGLFTKRTSSIYREATKASINYNLEKNSYGYNFEEIGKDYKTLGSNFFDSGYTSHTLSSANQPTEKLTISSEIGIRRDRAFSDRNSDANRLVANFNTSYQFNERLTAGLTLSNFKNTQRLYQKNINNYYVDSVSLALVNFNASTNATYFLDKEKKQMLSSIVSYQRSNSINKDTISTSYLNKNYLFNLTYNLKQEKTNYQINLSYINTSSTSLKSDIITMNAQRTQQLSDVLDLENSFLFSYTHTLFKNISNVQFLNGLKYTMSKNKELDIKSQVVFSNQDNTFRLLEVFIELNAAYAF